MDLKVPITISDELTEEVIKATGQLDLASGEIHRIEYQGWDVAARGLPWDSPDYEFTSGVLSNKGKDVEFRVDVNKVTGQYSVSASELLEIKVRAAALFAGLTGKDLLGSAGSRATGSGPATQAAAAAGSKPAPPARGGRSSRLH